MSDSDNKYEVVGKAIYIEFIKPGQVQQFLLMPEGLASPASPGQVRGTSPMTLLKRRLTVSAPKKTWRSFAIGTLVNPKGEAKSTGLFTPAELQVRAFTQLAHSNAFFQGLLGNNWLVQNDKVIVVEVTPDDLLDVRRGKTPYKVLGRIMKTRRAYGFPAVVKPFRPTV